MTYLEATLLNDEMIEALKDARRAAQMIYGFVGGDDKGLGRAIWKIGALLDTIDNWEEEIDEEDSDVISA